MTDIAARITDFKTYPVSYDSPEGMCTGTNVTYRFDGRPHSSRLPHYRGFAEAWHMTIRSLTAREKAREAR